MCFSASASFGSSLLLAIIGIVSLRKAKKSPQQMLAATPFLFSLQQAAEGMIWLVKKFPQQLVPFLMPSAYVFVSIAFVIWPIWIPTAILLMEQHAQRKKILQTLTLIGTSVSAYFLYTIFSKVLFTDILQHHIAYAFADISMNAWYVTGTLYVLSTIVPFFISSHRNMKVLGTSLAFSCALSFYFVSCCFISVWCFFAALLSLMIVILV